jgi:hypothetical protein
MHRFRFLNFFAKSGTTLQKRRRFKNIYTTLQKRRRFKIISLNRARLFKENPNKRENTFFKRVDGCGTHPHPQAGFIPGGRMLVLPAHTMPLR